MIRYISWAHDFDSLLSDGVGVELFWSYLEEESLGHLLKFWLAVEGLKKESDEAIIGKYIKCIIKNFIRTSVIELDNDILEEIAAQTTTNESIFNRAQESVKKLMHSGPYLNFLKSDIYLNYVQKIHEESNEMTPHLFQPEGAEDNNHENGDSQEWNIPKNAPTNLPTVPEEEPIHHATATLSTINTKQLFNTSSKSDQEIFPSYHAMGSVYNPVSRVDSEIQSCSSGAYTTTDDNYSSFTELEHQHRKKIKRKAKMKQRIIQQDSAQQHQINHHIKEEEDSRKLIPRPARSGSVPPRPLSPKSFAQVLTERLQNILDQKKHEKKTFEILNNKLNHIETASAGASLPPEGFESDQSILDEHVSRIWKDKTPIHVRSPGDFAGRPRSPKGGKWNSMISASRTLPSSNKKANGCYDHLSFHDDVTFGKSSNYLHTSSLHGQQRIMEWVNKVSCPPSDVYSDEDILRPKSSKSSYSRSNYKQQSRSEHLHHSHSGGSSSTAPMPWNTHQQLQEVNRRLLLTTMGPTTNKNSHHSSSVTYTFSNEPEGMPYRVKIQGHSSSSRITLYQVKNNLPKLGRYRFYFKTQIDGEPCFEEERDDAAFVPVWSEGKIIVQCRDDVV